MVDRPVRVYFEVEGDARFLSHLDLLRLTERAIRRSRLEVVYTAGFNPHVRISMPAARPVGIATRGDCFVIRIDSERSTEEIGRRLAAAFPAGVRICRVEEGPPPREARPVWLSMEIKDGEAAARAVAAELRSGADDRFHRVRVDGATVMIEMTGGGLEQRPPRIREFVERVEEALRSLGCTEGAGIPTRHFGQPPEALR